MFFASLIIFATMEPDTVSDLRQKRTSARGKIVCYMTSPCCKSQDDDLALKIHHLERHYEFMMQLQLHLDEFGVDDNTQRGYTERIIRIGSVGPATNSTLR